MADLRELVAREADSLCTIAAAVIGSAVVGAGASMAAGSANADATSSAAQAQQASNAQAIAEQQRQFNVNQTNLQPWLTAGKAALGGQMDLLGLGGTPAVAASTGQPDYAGYVQGNADLLAAYQRDGAGKTMDQYGQEHWNGIGSTEQRTVTPFTGSQGTPGTPAVDAATAQQTAITGLQNSPYYQSLYRNGQNAILANGSATGGLRGGNINASLANFGADTLAQTIQTQLSNLGGISGQGANTGSTLGTLGSNTANNVSGLLTSNGQAQAGGILAGAGFRNAGFTGGLTQALGGVTQGLSMYGGGYGGFSGAPTPVGFTPSAGDPIAGLY